MARLKETSDSLSHPVVEAPHIAVPPSRRTAADYAALGVATCGVGLLPLAPGTWGSAVGVLLYAALLAGFDRARAAAALSYPAASEQTLQVAFTSALLLVIFLVCMAGTWAATRCEKLLKRKDPGAVVIDEVAGQLITFLFVPGGARGWLMLAGFVAFRLFDTWKPYPINRLEALESGLGVMADDVLAGAYAATLVALLAAAQLLLS
jgi:phosphatidylglycerophosphatase A